MIGIFQNFWDRWDKTSLVFIDFLLFSISGLNPDANIYWIAFNIGKNHTKYLSFFSKMFKEKKDFGLI